MNVVRFIYRHQDVSGKVEAFSCNDKYTLQERQLQKAGVVHVYISLDFTKPLPIKPHGNPKRHQLWVVLVSFDFTKPLQKSDKQLTGPPHVWSILQFLFVICIYCDDDLPCLTQFFQSTVVIHRHKDCSTSNNIGIPFWCTAPFWYFCDDRFFFSSLFGRKREKYALGACVSPPHTFFVRTRRNPASHSHGHCGEELDEKNIMDLTVTVTSYTADGDSDADADSDSLVVDAPITVQLVLHN